MQSDQERFASLPRSNGTSGITSDSSGNNNEVQGIGSGSSTQESSGETSVISTTTRTLADGTRSVTTVTSSKPFVDGRLQRVTKTVTKHLPSLPVVTKEYTTLKDGAVEVRTSTTVVHPGGMRETIVETQRQPSAAAQDEGHQIDITIATDNDTNQPEVKIASDVEREHPEYQNIAVAVEDFPLGVQVRDENFPSPTVDQEPWHKRKKVKGCLFLLFSLLLIVIIIVLTHDKDDDKTPSQTQNQGNKESSVAGEDNYPTKCHLNAELVDLLKGPTRSKIDSHFSERIAIYGSVAVVAAHNYRSDIYDVDSANRLIYVYSLHNGKWEWKNTFYPESRNTPANFGWDVDVSENTIVVGAYSDDGFRDADGQWRSKGRAYVYNRFDSDNGNEGSWNLEAILSPQSPYFDARFGVSVAIDGNTIAVGAWRDNYSRGAVYVFQRREQGMWAETQSIKPSDARKSSFKYSNEIEKGNFGRTVTLSEKFMAVKAPHNLLDSAYGVVYLYELSNDGTTWGEKQKLSTPEGSFIDVEGKDLVFIGNYLIVGAPGIQKVYIFELNKTSDRFQLMQELLPPIDNDGLSSSLPGGYFGISVDADGSNIIVGTGGGNAAFVYSLLNEMWVLATAVVQENSGIVSLSLENYFGFSVAISGENVFVGSLKPFAFDEEEDGAVSVFALECVSSFYSIPTVEENDEESLPILSRPKEECEVIASFETDVSAESSKFIDSHMGERVAIDGSEVVVGAHNYRYYSDDWPVGIVFALSLNGDQWLQSGDFTPYAEENDVNFGWDVAISGDTIVIGSKDENGYRNTDEKWIGRGYAYVFVKNSSRGWTQQALLSPNYAFSDAEFGVSVDIDGDTIVVGAWGDRNRRGSAFIFRRSGTNWAEKQTLAPDSSKPESGTMVGHEKGNFGRSVAIYENGRYVAVKAPSDTVGGETAVGAVYIYEEKDLNIWSEKQKLSTPEGIDLENIYGRDLSFGDGYLAVGAPGKETVYIFEMTLSFTGFTGRDFIFELKQEMNASDGKIGNLFGISVGADGSSIVVGASGHDRAYVFTNEGNGEWKEREIISPQNASPQNQVFGFGVAVSGDRMIVGAPGQFTFDGQHKGSAEIFNFYCS